MQKVGCSSINVNEKHRTNCTVHQDVICLGSRQFSKRIKCNWTRGSKYFTALILSITLGGFGVDRFYLGHWQEGIGKLFSFGMVDDPLEIRIFSNFLFQVDLEFGLSSMQF